MNARCIAREQKTRCTATVWKGTSNKLVPIKPLKCKYLDILVVDIVIAK